MLAFFSVPLHSMKIHSTAIVSREAEIASDVEIGPYVCIEGKATIGPGCVIHAHAILSGRVVLGKNNTIGYGAVIGAPPQDLSFRPGISSDVWVGDNNVIREYCTIHRGSREGGVTRIGHQNFLMAGVHLAHDVRMGDHVIIANNALLGGHVQIQDRVFVGGGSVFHQYVRVGQMALTQGLSAFSKDVPPFTIGAERNCVAGINSVGLRRAGLDPDQRMDIKHAFKLLYKSGLNTTQALEHAQGRKWGAEGQLFFNFIAEAKKRGICDLLENSSGWRPPLEEE